MLYLITSYTVRQNMVLVGRLRKARVKLQIKIKCKKIVKIINQGKGKSVNLE